MKTAPTTTLSNGIRVANFSSAHAFRFDDGSELPACDSERCKALMLRQVEKTTDHPMGWTDISLSFEMSEVVRRELDRINNDPDIDIVLVPLPVLLLVREQRKMYDEGLCPNGWQKCRGVRMADRVTKVAHHDRFCV